VYSTARILRLFSRLYIISYYILDARIKAHAVVAGAVWQGNGDMVLLRGVWSQRDQEMIDKVSPKQKKEP